MCNRSKKRTNPTRPVNRRGAGRQVQHEIRQYLQQVGLAQEFRPYAARRRRCARCVRRIDAGTPHYALVPKNQLGQQEAHHRCAANRQVTIGSESKKEKIVLHSTSVNCCQIG